MLWFDVDDAGNDDWEASSELRASSSYTFRNAARSPWLEAHSLIPDFSPASYNEPDHDCSPAWKASRKTSESGDC